MKNLKLFASAILFLVVYQCTSQNIAITDDNGYTADPSAMLDVKSTDKGILVPRLSAAQRTAIVSPAAGLWVFDMDETAFFFYNGSGWQKITTENEYQTLSISNDTLFLTNGGFVVLPESGSGSPDTSISGTSYRVGYSSSGTWTCPEGVTEVIVQLWGGSGGGGGGDYCINGGFGCYVNGNTTRGGNGGRGGHGGYNKAVISVTPGNSYSITIGAAGVAGSGGVYDPTTHATSGTAGGATSFDGILTAAGGGAGQKGVSVTNNCTDGADGADGAIINYSIEQISIPSTSAPRPYVPEGYTTSNISVGSKANGGSGGSGGYKAFSSGVDFGDPGGAGVSGYCIISY